MTLGPLMIDVAGLELSHEERERLCSPLVGGVVLFTRNFADAAQLRALVRDIHDLRQPSLLVAVDQEGGRVQRFQDGLTRLPPARWLGHQYDLDARQGRKLARLCGWIMAAEMLDLGVDLSFAPVVDLDWGVSEIIGDRAMHRDPDCVLALADAYISGMQAAGMVAVAKHFPGHGAVVPDSHLELPQDPRELADMEEDLRPYHRLVERGLAAVMVAHVVYPNVNRDIASLSSYWLQDYLRGYLNFGGAIFSDDLNMAGVAGVGDMSARVDAALSAGADMALICNNPQAAAAVIEGGVHDSGPASHGRLAALRPRLATQAAAPLRARDDWQDAQAKLGEAMARPSLTLDG